MKSPLTLEPLFHVGPVAITEPVVVAWVVIAALAGASALATRKLSLQPSRAQATVELIISTSTARSTTRCRPTRRRSEP